MKKESFTQSLPFRLLVALAVGIAAGLALSAIDGSGIATALLNIIVTVKFISSQFINFCVPLIIIGFIAPSITRLGNNASRMLAVALCIAYISSIGAAFFATGAGFTILPFLNISPEVDGLKELPPVVFELTIPQIMPVMSALFFSVMVGLAATWNKSKLITGVLEEFQKIVLSIVTKFVIPVLPVLIGCTFCTLAYEGTITKQLPIFLIIIGMLMPVCSATPAAIGVSATIVPTLVPTLIEMKHAARKSPANSILPGNKVSARLTVASMAPITLAECAKAPARMNIQIISIICPLAAP